MESIEVLAEIDDQGRISPHSFRWNNHNYIITSTGRQWQAVNNHHFLVMAAGDQVFHLVFTPETGSWCLVPTYGPGSHPAV